MIKILLKGKLGNREVQLAVIGKYNVLHKVGRKRHNFDFVLNYLS